VFDTYGPGWIPRKLRTALMVYWPVARRWMRLCLRFGLRSRPDLAVISQGINLDGFVAATLCRELGIPYVLISQKAADMYWPGDDHREEARLMHTGALRSLFVSEHNRRLTEEQLGCTLANSAVVRNPYHADWTQRAEWPSDSQGYRFACLARLDVREKGQDLLLRVLAQPKWRSRPIEVRFYGSGHNAEGLEAMARWLGLHNVSFRGFTEDPASIWNECHGLILPSRCEGLPLSLVETMLCGRVAVVTDVGGASEVVSDGSSGFLASAATEQHLDEALERAWERRDEWPAIGQAAATEIRKLVPPDPAAALAALLLASVDSPAACANGSGFPGRRTGNATAVRG
jgi:glycosyltransferase involved in cell wall biosynthesis